MDELGAASPEARDTRVDTAAQAAAPCFFGQSHGCRDIGQPAKFIPALSCDLCRTRSGPWKVARATI